VRFGFHLSIAGGLEKAPLKAGAMGLDCLQIFAGNPRGWRQIPLGPRQADDFQAAVSAARLSLVVVHAPYLLNLASPDGVLWRKSWTALAEQLKRAGRLGAKAVVVHPGSRGDKSAAWGIRRVVAAVAKALEAARGPARCWLENTAGGGGQMGGDLAQLAEMLARLEGAAVGVCLDTAHAWGAGYRLDTVGAMRLFVDEVDRVLGLSRVGLWHLNDTRAPLASRRDRHDHLGKGLIGNEGFRALIGAPRLAKAFAVMETPKDSRWADLRNLAYVRRLARAAPSAAS